jgi:uncharacterized repeat protein (TIGR01451 family)
MRNAFLFVGSLLVTAVVGHAADPAVLSKAFAQPTIFPGSTTTLTFTLRNPNAGIALTGLAFTDTLPAGLVVGTPDGLTANCPSATVTAVASSNSISLTGATLVASASCTVSVTVLAVTPGAKVNTTSTVASNEATAGAAATATLVVFFVADTSTQMGYAANPAAGESFVDIVNTGANGNSLLGPGFGGAAGNICANVFTFSPDEQLISCCSCLITPNGVVNLGVNRDLTIKTLTGVVPTSVVVKVVSTLAGTGGTGSSCTNSAATVATATIVSGMAVWGTTLHQQGAAFAATESRFTPTTLSPGDLASIGGRCSSILGNGSGFGVCLSCRAGALGGEKQ